MMSVSQGTCFGLNAIGARIWELLNTVQEPIDRGSEGLAEVRG